MEVNGKSSPTKIGAYLNNINRLNKAGEQARASNRRSKSVLKNDKINLTSWARDLVTARAQLDSIPDVREERVAEIKKKIANGAYTIDSKKIAFNMIKKSLLNEIID